MDKGSEKIVEHLFRSEYGKILAILTKIFGPSHIELAEDVVQETLISALSNWSTEGVPENPTGWLVQVAKRKALNEIKHNSIIQKHQDAQVYEQQLSEENTFEELDYEIKDSQLRMIFACCHYSLDVKSQVALTLKTLCGFGVKEVAKALLMTESNVNKRLYRAKEKIRTSKTPFDIPSGQELDEKLDAVSLTLYLLFNEGYNSSTGESLIQKELCLEAIRLTKLLVDQFEKQRKLNALLALMCFHVARFDARIDEKGAIILFEDQDRSLWNKDLIHLGMQYLKQSIHDKSLSSYHIEARIAAEHCLAPSFEKTNWETIYQHYALLAKLKPNPVIKLNLAIIQSQLQGVEASLSLLETLEKDNNLSSYYLLPATQGIFKMKLNQHKEALELLKRSLKLNPSKKEREFIQSKILECEKLIPKN